MATADGFRPISLQNWAPKLITKILTNRLPSFINELIGPYQTGFVKGCCIADNFLLATELVQCCHVQRAPTVVLKLDFHKAFKVLALQGFCDVWRG